MNNSSRPVRVTLQNAAKATILPEPEQFGLWVNCAIDCADWPIAENSCITIRVVDEAESGILNSKYRDIASPTNVLAFPVANDDYPFNNDTDVELGDLAICAAVVARESQEQLKSLTAHFAHMTVHGSLHLLGYDHIDEQGALEMESLEKRVMEKLGFPDPYKNDNQDLKRA